MLTAATLGFLLGLRHASDPDHVIALSTLLARHRRPTTAAAIGAAWGLGHGATLLTVGAAIVLLRLGVPERIALGLELAVGVVLVALGIGNLRARSRVHDHAPGDRDDLDAGSLRAALRRSACVGLAHGLAGSAAIALLALAAMPSAALALCYLGVFALGTIGGMIAISLGVGAPLALLPDRAPLRLFLVTGSGALSIGFGAWIVWEIGFVRGLIG